VTGGRVGLYVHLPYCRSRCGYCAFVVTTDESSREQYLNALKSEARLVGPEAVHATFDSLYLGGGTPSLLPEGDLESLLEDLRAAFRFDMDCEVTLEANPEDVTVSKRNAWKRAGVNRVSLGVQSLEDAELAAVGRRHDAVGARRAIAALGGTGLSLSADLILGLPEQTRASFRRSVEAVAAAGFDHLSIYLLETEKSRAIEDDRRTRPERYLSDEDQAEAWLEAGAVLAGSGLFHYEISNWARAGREARHNVKYWKRVPTLGLGISAHELWDDRRRANVSAIPQYVAALSEGRRPTALDQPIGALEAARERIVLGLRLREGIAATELEDWIAREGDRLLNDDYCAWLDAGLLAREDGRIRFTDRGFLLSNEVLCRFV
jgi:oxygen-independent coproporphyrinogen-3 oxidase